MIKKVSYKYEYLSGRYRMVRKRAQASNTPSGYSTFVALKTQNKLEAISGGTDTASSDQALSFNGVMLTTGSAD